MAGKVDLQSLSMLETFPQLLKEFLEDLVVPDSVEFLDFGLRVDPFGIFPSGAILASDTATRFFSRLESLPNLKTVDLRCMDLPKVDFTKHPRLWALVTSVNTFDPEIPIQLVPCKLTLHGGDECWSNLWQFPCIETPILSWCGSNLRRGLPPSVKRLEVY